MKLRSLALAIILLSGSIATIQAQNEYWSQTLDGEVLWVEVTSLGYLMVCTESSLQGIDIETGDMLWMQRQFGSVPRSDYQEIPNSPMVSINKGEAIYFLEPAGGRIIFDSGKAGIYPVSGSYFLYKNNGILLTGEKAGSKEPMMIMLDISSGDVLWAIEEDFGRIIAINEISDSEILVVTLFNNYNISSQSGEIIWKNSTSAEAASLDKMGAFGNLMKAVAETVTADMEIDLYYYKNPTQDVFYIASNQEKSSTMSSSDLVFYSNNYIAYNISDGSLLWDKPLEMNGKVGEVIFHEQGMIILPNDGNKTRINLFDYMTQVGKWGKKGRGINIKGGVYDYVNTDNGFLLVSTNGNANFLSVLDGSQGILKFDKPAKVNGHVIGTVSIAKGILYITDEEVNVLDPATGGFLLSKPIQTKPTLTAEQDNKIYLFDLKDDILKAIDKTTAKAIEISSSKIQFDGKENPHSIELLESGIFIHSDQNMALIGYDGSLQFQKYFPAPREAGWKRALLYAQAVRAAYIGATSYYAAGALQTAAPQVQEEDALAGAVVQGFGEMYEQLGNAASDFAKESFQRANTRFKATTSGRDFMIVLSDQGKSNSLLKVNKNTGEIDGTIDLGKERDPKYAVDDVTGQVYYITESKEITSYKF